jgi:hypothetical protein
LRIAKSLDFVRSLSADRCWQLLVFAVVIFACVNSATEAADPTNDVAFVLPKNFSLPNAKLLIYRVPDARHDWPTVQAEVAIHEMVMKVSLPDGEYVAEIGGAVDNALILVRSPPFSVPTTTRVALSAEKHTCGATISGKSARLLQVALRRFGNGELRWSAEKSPPPVTLITSPDQPYVCCLMRRKFRE